MTFARSHAQPEVCSRRRGSGSGRRSGLAVDGAIFEPNDPQLVQIEIPLSRLPEAWDGITITQFSAFHYDDRFWVVPLRKAIDGEFGEEGAISTVPRRGYRFSAPVVNPASPTSPSS